MIHFGLKTIFIHIPRTAGNSISFALRQHNNYNCHDKIKHEDILFFYKNYKKEFNTFFKFCCIRNPFEKVYSHYVFRLIRQDKDCINNNFIDWILKFYNKTKIVFRPQLDYISLNGKIKVDYIMKYENLWKDFDFICKKLNISNKLNHLFPSCKDDYRTKYDKKTIKIISDIFKKDIKYFGYTFEGVN